MELTTDVYHFAQSQESQAALCLEALAALRYTGSDGHSYRNTLTLVGYSNGGDAVTRITHSSQAMIDHVITIDPVPKPARPAEFVFNKVGLKVNYQKPGNVLAWDNFYEPRGANAKAIGWIFKGAQIKGASNIEITDVDHFNIVSHVSLLDEILKMPNWAQAE